MFKPHKLLLIFFPQDSNEEEMCAVEEEAGFCEIEGAADNATLVFPSSFLR